ncbi:MAG TPA: choice-of-anchor Q domain-containing protein [Puia sp.]|nr:choice-of-anchor Q domain-containing protein [Puia sp.]
MKKTLLFVVTAFIIFFSCKKDSFITSSGAIISFSADTLYFDTVFTSTGSITEFVKINNLNDQKLMLSGIKLMGGTQSPFKINIDGAVGPESTNIEMAANDSLYIFVTVTINPSSANLPFVIEDSIQVSFNGNTRYIQLQAWGQNAHFLQNEIITGNVIWTNDLPYVILGGLLVDSNSTLTIEKGCKIYNHADAPFLIDGTLQVQGEKYDSTKVYFSSDRLDDPYNGYPGSWPGIFFRSTSKDNLLEFAVIRNAYQGIIAENPSVNSNPKVALSECIIDNIYDAGILGVQSDIQATNCLVSNCGKNILLGYGGNYNFTHCTVASYSNDYIQHTMPVLVVSNYITQGNSILTGDLTGNFVNCIFWGDNGTVDDEVVVYKQGNTVFNVSFSNCLWKVKDMPAATDTSNIISNLDPLFELINNQQRIYDFHLMNGSPAIDRGKDAGIVSDLDGNPRPVGNPDLGCYEKQ